MQKLICGNGNTYEVHDETVCCPSGSANVRNYFEIYMPEKTMTFNQFEALCKNTDAMQHITVKEPKPDKPDEYFEAVFTGYTLPVEIAKKLHQTYDASTGETISETRLFARMEQLTFIERKLAELGLM